MPKPIKCQASLSVDLLEDRWLLNGGSVPWSRSTRYWAGVSIRRHSSSECATAKG